MADSGPLESPPARFGDFYWNSVSFCDESNSCIISLGKLK
jgi:hypothetical protein